MFGLSSIISIVIAMPLNTELTQLSFFNSLKLNGQPFFNISFEFFPPKQESDLPKLHETVDRLSTYNPDFVSFTYGAGGNTRQLTTKVSKEAKLSDKFEVMSHLTCIAHNEKEILDILKDL